MGRRVSAPRSHLWDVSVPHVLIVALLHDIEDLVLLERELVVGVLGLVVVQRLDDTDVGHGAEGVGRSMAGLSGGMGGAVVLCLGREKAMVSASRGGTSLVVTCRVNVGSSDETGCGDEMGEETTLDEHWMARRGCGGDTGRGGCQWAGRPREPAGARGGHGGGLSHAAKWGDHLIYYCAPFVTTHL